MRTVVNMVLHDEDDEPVAEVRVENPTVAPALFDLIQFEPEVDDTSGGLCGRVTCRVFRFLPHCIDVEIIAEVLNDNPG